MNFNNHLCRNKFLLLEDLLKVHFQETSEKINLCSVFVQNRAVVKTVPVEKILNDFRFDFLMILNEVTPQEATPESKEFHFFNFISIMSHVPFREQSFGPEVNQHTVGNMRKVHVVEKLFPMLFIHKVDSFQLKDDVVIDHKIHAIFLVKFNIIPVDRQFHLPLDLEPLLFQKVLQCGFISGLQQPTVILTVHLHGDPSNVRKELILPVVLCYQVHRYSFNGRALPSKFLKNLFEKSVRNEIEKARALMSAECKTRISSLKSVLRASFQKHFYNKKYLISLE